MLEKMNIRASQRSGRLAVFHMRFGCVVRVTQPENTSAAVSAEAQLIAGKPLQSLRALKAVVIPEGVQKIEDSWFCGSCIESVEIPAGVL